MKIDYGNTVMIKHGAPEQYRPGLVGAVVSLYEVHSEKYVKRTGISVGALVVGVEFPDGSFADVPQEYVALCNR